MRASAKGKYHNLGWDRDEATATVRQRWALYLASERKLDYRDTKKPLSEAQADQMIRKCNTEKAHLGSKIPINDHFGVAYFHAVMRRAINAANEAGAEWDRKHPKVSYQIFLGDPDNPDDDVPENYVDVRGELGDVYIRWPDKRTKFGQFLRSYYFDNQYERVFIPHNYVNRFEHDLLLVCYRAAFAVFKEWQVLGMKLMAHRGE
jgi:hypothetical protein